MPKHGEEILIVINKLKSDAHVLEDDEFVTTIKDVVREFTYSLKYQYPIWEHLKDWVGVDYKFAWKWLLDFPFEKKIILILEPADDEKAFIFSDSRQLVQVLSECYRFTFYLTDSDRSFLLSYNDHDNFIASGTAKQWLVNYHIVREQGVKIFSS